MSQPLPQPREVDNPAFGKTRAIVYPHFHRFSILEISYVYDAAPRESSMRGPLWRPTFAAIPQISVLVPSPDPTPRSEGQSGHDPRRPHDIPRD